MGLIELKEWTWKSNKWNKSHNKRLIRSRKTKTDCTKINSQHTGSIVAYNTLIL